MGDKSFPECRRAESGNRKRPFLLLFRGHCFVFSSIRFLSTPVHFCSMFFPQNAAPIFLGLLSPKIRSLLPHPPPGAKMHLTFTLSLEAPCPKLPGKRYLSYPADASLISRMPFKKSCNFLLSHWKEEKVFPSEEQSFLPRHPVCERTN